MTPRPQPASPLPPAMNSLIRLLARAAMRPKLPQTPPRR